MTAKPTTGEKKSGYVKGNIGAGNRIQRGEKRNHEQQFGRGEREHSDCRSGRRELREALANVVADMSAVRSGFPRLAD
eukprot:15920392-Heterocapsa_arctica.AAC.1